MASASVLLGTGALVAAPGAALAANCSTLTNPVYVAGSSAVKPFLAAVAAELAGLTTPITVVYQGQGSCTGVSALTGTTSTTITGTGIIWGTDGKEISGGCTLSLAGDAVDIGVSDVYASSCGATVPAGVKDFFGPIQAMTFVVPKASTQTSISAEAAYLMLGLGSAGAVAPWTDQTLVNVRSATSGTQQMIAAAIGVPAAKWLGVANSGSGAVVTGLAAAATAGNSEKAIGILSTDVVDKNRTALKTLAYQHYDQTCGYWPDSSDSTFDKQNVRDGHYMIWGPLHMLAKVAGSEPTNPNVKKIIDYLTGAVQPTGFDLIQLEATSGVVPECAMRVSRTDEVGPLSSYMPAKSCECKYVKEATGTAPASCKTCSTSADCTSGAPACNYGYCEVK